MRIPLKVLPLLAAAIAMLAIALVLSSRPAARGPASPASATPERFVSRPAVGEPREGIVVALGRIEPVSRILRVAGPTGNDAGRISLLFVDEGERVSRGQLLAMLDTEPRLAASLAQAEANASMKRAQLAQKLAELENTEKSLAAAVEQPLAGRDRAQWELDRHGRLRTAGLYSEPALIDKRPALLSANRKLDTSKLALERVQARGAKGFRLEESVARAELAAAEAGAEKARADHVQSHVQAPADGTILRLYGRLGQRIGSEGFAEMGDVSTMSVRAEVFEADVTSVSKGQPASITSLTALENVRMDLEAQGRGLGPDADERCRRMLAVTGLEAHTNKRQDQLSGSQRERVPIARALVNEPSLVLADEPTAALDRQTRHDVVALMRQVARERGMTVSMVTHDNRVFDLADRILEMEDGRIVGSRQGDTPSAPVPRAGPGRRLE